MENMLIYFDSDTILNSSYKNYSNEDISNINKEGLVTVLKSSFLKTEAPHATKGLESMINSLTIEVIELVNAKKHINNLLWKR